MSAIFASCPDSKLVTRLLTPSVGFGLAFATNAGPLLITELAYPTQRGQFTSIYNSSWYFGSILAAWATYAAFMQKEGSNWSWRIPSLVQAVGSILQVCLIWFIPESPRWLVNKGYFDAARTTVAQTNANGDLNNPVVLTVYKEIVDTLKWEKEEKRTMTPVEIAKDPVARKRLLIGMSAGPFSAIAGTLSGHMPCTRPF